MLREDFDGHLTAEARVAGSINFSHATGAKWGDNFVRAESGPDGKRHRVWIDLTLTTTRYPKSWERPFNENGGLERLPLALLIRPRSKLRMPDYPAGTRAGLLLPPSLE